MRPYPLFSIIGFNYNYFTSSFSTPPSGGVEQVIGPQALLGERSFLEIVRSRTGDIRSPNNILGFDGINGHGHRRGQDPTENNGMEY